MFVVLIAFTAFFLALKWLVSFFDNRRGPVPSTLYTPEQRRTIKIKFKIPLTTISCAIVLDLGFQNRNGAIALGNSKTADEILKHASI